MAADNTCFHFTTSELVDAVQLVTVTCVYLVDVVLVFTFEESRFIERKNGLVVAFVVVWRIFDRPATLPMC